MRVAKKVEPPLTRARRATGWSRRVHRRCRSRLQKRTNGILRFHRLDDAAPAGHPLAGPSGPAMLCRTIRNRPRGGSWCGLAPGYNTALQAVFRSRIRTRDTRFMRPMLYPSELSSGAACGIRTRDLRLRMPVLYQTELMPLSWNPPVLTSAYATAAPRAPDGPWNPYRCCQSW